MEPDILKDWADTVGRYRDYLIDVMPGVDNATIAQLVIDWHRMALERAREVLHTDIRHMDTIQISHIVPDVARRMVTDAVGIHRR